MPERNELWFDKNGSGSMEITFDMGEMAGMVQGMMGELEESNNEEPKGMWDKSEKMDSSINMYNTMPDSVKQTLDNPELLKNISYRINVDTENEIAKMSMKLNYKNIEHLSDILKTFKDIQSSKNGGAMAAVGGDTDLSTLFKTFKTDLNNGIIQLEALDIEEMKDDPEFDEMITAIEDPANSENPEMMEMFSMMFGGDIETIVHAPGKIIFTNDLNAQIDGNTVTFNDNLLEMIKSGKSLARVIKFEN